MSDRDDTSIRSWNAIADDWIAHADANDYRIHYLMPRMLAMLGDVNGKTVLDLGCGEGGYARELRRRGARVTGADGSERLIEVAEQRARSEALDVRFVHTNANALIGLNSIDFDVVVASMSLMDVEDYPGGDTRGASGAPFRRCSRDEHHAPVLFRARVRVGAPRLGRGDHAGVPGAGRAASPSAGRLHGGAAPARLHSARVPRAQCHR